MSRRETYESETEKLLTPIAERFGVRIYDIEYVKEGSDWYLRAYIDKTGGVTIMDCENVSRALSDELDKKDFIDMHILLFGKCRFRISVSHKRVDSQVHSYRKYYL